MPSNRFSTPQRRAFLDALAGNPNISAACKVARVHSILVYAERLKSPEFCREWADALATGYARLEAHGLEQALKLANGKLKGEKREQFEKDQKLINAQLSVHRAAVRGEAARPKAAPKTDIKAANQRVVAQLRLMRARHVASNDAA